MPEKRNQHYVPQYYFRHFSEDGKRINLLTVHNGRTITGAAIKKQCARPYFYGEARAEITITKLEDLTRPAISRMQRERSLPPDKNALLSAVLFQYSRSKLERERAAPAWESFRTWAVSEESPVDAGQAWNVDPLALQVVRMKSYFDLVPAACDLDAALLCNDNEVPFIFSDSPVVIHNPASAHIADRGTCGLAAAGLQIVMPIDSKLALLLYDRHHYKPADVDRGCIRLTNPNDTMALNALQMHNCHAAVYFGEASAAPAVQALWKRHAPFPAPAAACMRVVDLAINGEEPTAEAAHIFDPPIAYTLELSVLQTIPVEDDGRIRFRRGAKRPRFN